ncbi:hypothetical protein WN943_006671 [Citrus x changshan-huyou]
MVQGRLAKGFGSRQGSASSSSFPSSHSTFKGFTSLRTALALTAASYASCDYFDLTEPSQPSRLISRFPYLVQFKGNEMGKPKRSPVGEFLPIPKPSKWS